MVRSPRTPASSRIIKPTSHQVRYISPTTYPYNFLRNQQAYQAWIIGMTMSIDRWCSFMFKLYNIFQDAHASSMQHNKAGIRFKFTVKIFQKIHNKVMHQQGRNFALTIACISSNLTGWIHTQVTHIQAFKSCIIRSLAALKHPGN